MFQMNKKCSLFWIVQKKFKVLFILCFLFIHLFNDLFFHLKCDGTLELGPEVCLSKKRNERSLSRFAMNYLSNFLECEFLNCS